MQVWAQAQVPCPGHGKAGRARESKAVIEGHDHDVLSFTYIYGLSSAWFREWYAPCARTRDVAIKTVVIECIITSKNTLVVTESRRINAKFKVNHVA
jgi:hypothetical protein